MSATLERSLSHARKATRSMRALSPVVDLGVPRPVVRLVALAAQICLLTYWMLPKLNKLLAFWLTPKAG